MERITDREIVDDINKMKDLRRNIKSFSKEIIRQYKNEINIINIFLDNKIFIYIVLILFAVNFNSILFKITLYLFVQGFINKLKNDKERLENNIKNEKIGSELFLGITEQFIENNETILDSRKDKELTKSQIKNINISFLYDERYSFDLKRVNNKYDMKPIQIEIKENEIMRVDKFCEELNTLYPGEEVKIKSKVLLYNSSVIDKF